MFDFSITGRKQQQTVLWPVLREPKMRPKNRVPVTFEVVATNTSLFVEQNDLQFGRCPEAYHKLLSLIEALNLEDSDKS